MLNSAQRFLSQAPRLAVLSFDLVGDGCATRWTRAGGRPTADPHAG